MSILKRETKWVVTEEETAIVPFYKAELDTTADVVDGEIVDDAPLVRGRRLNRPVREYYPRERQLENEIREYQQERECEDAARRQRKDVLDRIQSQQAANEHAKYLKWEERRAAELELENSLRREQYEAEQSAGKWVEITTIGLCVIAVVIFFFIVARNSSVEEVLATVYQIVAIVVLVAIGWGGVKTFNYFFKR